MAEDSNTPHQKTDGLKIDLVDDTQAVFYAIDPDEEKNVVKKLDRVIMPLMAFVYFLMFLDKQNINYASVFGLSETLHLTNGEYSWAVSLFYFGQLISEYPAAYLMSRFPVVRFVGICMFVPLFAAPSSCQEQLND